MKINTNLLNLIRQILELDERRHGLQNGPEWSTHSKEVVRLKDAAVADMIATAKFETTYTRETALIKLNQTLEMFKIYDKHE